MTIRVLAVIVVHNGDTWLDRTLSYLANQTRPPDKIYAADLGSGDRCARALRLSGLEILHGRAEDGVGDAVDAALAADRASGRPGAAWVWILHDDSPPRREALAELLRLAVSDPDIAVVGPKLRHWNDMHMRDMGLTCDLTGFLYERIRDEVDDGQHDEPGPVLAVNSAGALIRADVWEQLGGFDAELRRRRDELDFGWRVNRAGYRIRLAPEAVVLHAEAGNSGLRQSTGGPTRPKREARWGALYSVLTNLSLPMFMVVWLRLFLGQFMRAAAQGTLKRSPTRMRDEAELAWRLTFRLPALLSARSHKQRHATVPHAAIRPLLARSKTRWALRAEPFRNACSRAWSSKLRRSISKALLELNEFLVVAVIAAALPLGLLDLVIYQQSGEWATRADLVGHGQGLALCMPLFAQAWYASVTTRWPRGSRPAASRWLSWLSIVGLVVCVYLMGAVDSTFSEGRDLPKDEQERIVRETEIALTFALVVSATSVAARALLRAQKGSE